MKNNIRSNFDMLRAYEMQLWRLGVLAERYFAEDPNTSLLKLRQLSELLAQSLAARTGLYVNPEESQYELIRRLQGEGVLPKEVKQVLDQIRVMGNAANHALKGDHAAALSTLKLCWQLCLWFHPPVLEPGRTPAHRSAGRCGSRQVRRPADQPRGGSAGARICAVDLKPKTCAAWCSLPRLSRSPRLSRHCHDN